MKEKIAESVKAIKNKLNFKPEIGIILGTGLGMLAKDVEPIAVIPYQEIPHFPIPTVESHSGRFILGNLSGKKVAVMQGRFHYYEGYTMQEITHPIRVMHGLGIKILIVSNACGGLNPLFSAGDIMIITDHINLLGDNPLRGVTDPDFGPRFPDMYNCYDRELIALTEKVALDLKLPIRRGVYLATIGPNLETAAEYRFFRNIGADAVGMSTVPEVIVARQVGIKVLGLSVVTDMGLPDAMRPVNLAEILNIASQAEPKLTALVREVVRRL
ncbi:MAG: purine-nucleoside phosphorylase [candidate division WOR-3 bacterium]